MPSSLESPPLRRIDTEDPMKRWFSALLAGLVLMAAGTGCIGRMAVSGKVGEFNLTVVENRFARELVFLGLYIVMVYPIAGLSDLLIVNSIEFWSGENPVTGEARLARAGDSRTMEAADGSIGTTTLQPAIH
jgi:hypothetical protein